MLDRVLEEGVVNVFNANVSNGVNFDDDNKLLKPLIDNVLIIDVNIDGDDGDVLEIGDWELDWNDASDDSKVLDGDCGVVNRDDRVVEDVAGV
jgi:hypothetical protein